MHTKKFNAGDTILSEGENGDSAFLVLNGQVEVLVGKKSRIKRVATLDAGAVFGEMSLLDPGPRSATVKALTDIECVETSYDDFIASVQDNPEEAIAFMKTLVRRLRQMNELMANIDPGKRRLMDVFRDWQETLMRDEEDLSEEEKQRAHDMMLYGFPFF